MSKLGKLGMYVCYCIVRMKLSLFRDVWKVMHIYGFWVEGKLDNKFNFH